MMRPVCFALVILAVLSGCDPSYSDVRDVPSLPGSQAAPVLVTPRIHDPSLPSTYNPADGWSPTLQVDSLLARTFGVSTLGHQQHFVRDTVSLADIAAFLDKHLGERDFQRSPAPARWSIRYIRSGAEQPRLAAWVRDVPAEGGTDRTVVAVAYATPWPPGQDDTRTTFYVVFLGRGVVPVDGRAATVPR